MKKNRFGRTEYQISQLTFGGGWVGGILINSSEKIMFEALTLANENGINWIDTAEAYSNGISEKNIGKILPQMKENKFYISTKAKLNRESRESIFSQLDRKIDNSLKRLNKDYIDLYQLHNKIVSKKNIESFSPKEILKKGGIAESLEKLKSEGKIKHVGITALGDIEAINTVILSNQFDTAQVYYNLLNPSASFSSKKEWNDHDFTNLINNCKSLDMGIMNIRIFAAGYLATNSRHGREIPVTYGINERELNRRVHEIQSLLNNLDGTNSQKALRYGLSNENLSTIIIGLETISHLEEALKANQVGPLDSDILDKILNLQRNNFKQK